MGVPNNGETTMTDLLANAIAEAERFLDRAKECDRMSGPYEWQCKYRAATKRSSMDLTRALADLRRADLSQWGSK